MGDGRSTRQELGTVALIGGLLNAAAMTWIAADASETSSARWITTPALWLAFLFGGFFLLALIASTDRRAWRSDAGQAMVVSACGAVVSLLWALSSMDWTYRA